MREYDLIVFGATGRTPGAWWPKPSSSSRSPAFAGPSPDGAERSSIRSSGATTARFPEAESVEMVVADVSDAESMRSMAKRTRVICTTVGPYGRLGDAVVEACMAEGTDCCDLTGEVNWMRKNIDAHHDQAASKGIRIVHAAGFDSIPFDIGVYALQKAAVERLGGPATTVRTITTSSGRVLRPSPPWPCCLTASSATAAFFGSWGIPTPRTRASAGRQERQPRREVLVHPPGGRRRSSWRAATRASRRQACAPRSTLGEDFYAEAMGTGRGLSDGFEAADAPGLGAKAIGDTAHPLGGSRDRAARPGRSDRGGAARLLRRQGGGTRGSSS